MLVFYLIGINILTFLLFGVDKSNAIHRHRRIPERTLLLAALIGGSIGALLAMYLFHHKTRKRKFSVGVPAMLILHLAVFVLYLVWGGFK